MAGIEEGPGPGDRVVTGSGGTPVESWRGPGGRLWLGMALPVGIAALAVAALAAAARVLVAGKPQNGIAPAVFFVIFSGVAGWLLWKVEHTAWMVTRTTNHELLCRATARSWSLRPGEVQAVGGDVYGLLLVVTTPTGKIWLWGPRADRPGLLGAIRRLNPAAQIDRQVEPRSR